jgi:hypothetical protein
MFNGFSILRHIMEQCALGGCSMNPLLPTRNFFHAGYVVRNIGAVMDNMRAQFGVARWKVLTLPEGSPATALGMAYVGETMIELVEVDPEGELMAIHQGFAPTSEGEARLNHLAYLLDSEEELQTVIASFEASGVATAWLASFGDIFSGYYYADTRAQLGHYSEFICLGSEGREFLAEVPRN